MVLGSTAEVYTLGQAAYFLLKENSETWFCDKQYLKMYSQDAFFELKMDMYQAFDKFMKFLIILDKKHTCLVKIQKTYVLFDCRTKRIIKWRLFEFDHNSKLKNALFPLIHLYRPISF